MLGVGGVAGPMLPAAFAADYPSWDDVQAAMANESAKAAEVSKIQGLIQSLNQEVARTQAAAKVASDAFYEAQQAFFAQARRADELQAQADQQAALAAESANKAGRVAAQLYRDGGDDTSLELFFAGSAASTDDLLARLGTMDKLIERNKAVYSDAVTARDSAQSLSDQAVVARTERDRLQQEAEQKMVDRPGGGQRRSGGARRPDREPRDARGPARGSAGHHGQDARRLPGGRRGRPDRRGEASSGSPS